MQFKRFLPRRARTRVAAVIAAMAISSAGGVGIISMQPANATVGTTHRLVASSKYSNSSAVEKPNVTFTCNDVTGVFKLHVTALSVIANDHVSVWPNLHILFELWNSGGTDRSTGPRYHGQSEHDERPFLEQHSP